MTGNEKPKVLLLGKLEKAHKVWSHIEEIATVLTPRATNREDFIKESRSGTFDGVIAILRTQGQKAGVVDEELLNALPQSLKFICQGSAGYDTVDVEACTARKIQVSNCPTAVNDATADVAMFLILGCLRNFSAGIAALKAGNWKGDRNNRLVDLGHDPRGKVLGILGMGGIGKNLAAKARAFGMEIRYHNRNKLAQENDGGAEYVGFETLLRESDVLSLNLPLNSNTRHIISEEQFKIMKKGMVVVNTARGAVLDEDALVKALKSGQVSSAGLDVYENEPSVHSGLLELDNVLLIPHMGTWTEETCLKMEEWTIDNVRLALEKDHLKSIIPEQMDLEREIETAKGTLK